MGVALFMLALTTVPYHMMHMVKDITQHIAALS